MITADRAVDAVMAVFESSRLQRRRTPQEFHTLWDELTRQADARKRAETMPAVRLEQLQKRRR